MAGVMPPAPALHFVGFRDDRYWAAVRVWGRPSYIHMGWDQRARREIADGDTVVFANGPADQQPAERNWSDTLERLP
jgi:hypothetical protein